MYKYYQKMREHTEIICLIDRSGSMTQIKSDAIGGFNSFLTEQKTLPGSASLTLALFSNRYDIVYNNAPLDTIEPLTDKIYKTTGTTALFYAIGKTIDNVGIRLANTNEDERPNKILFIILPMVKKMQAIIKLMITHQRENYNWEFVFLAANQDAMKAAENISISRGNTMNFSSTSDSINTAYSNVSKMSMRYRAARVQSVSNGNLFDDDEQDATTK